MRHYFHKPYLIPLLAAMLCTAPLINAQALETSAEEAEEIRAFLQEYNDRMMEGFGETNEIVLDGELTVEQADGYYAATMPHISMLMPDGGKFDMGIVAYNIVPGDEENTWKITAALPTPMYFYEPAGDLVGRIELGQQNFAGIYNSTKKMWTRYNATYKDIQFQSVQDDLTLSFDEVIGRQNFVSVENNADALSGSGVLEANGFAVRGNDGEFTVGKMAIDFSMDQFNFKAAETFTEEMTALEKAAAESGGSLPDTFSFSEFTENLLDVFNGMEFTFTLNDISLTPPPAANNEGMPEKLAFGEFLYGFGLNGLQEDKLSMKLRLGYDGLEVEPLDQAFAETLPTKVNFDISAVDLPHRRLLQTGEQIFEQSQTVPNANPTMLMMPLMAQLPQMMTEAGTKIMISDISVATPTVEANSKGEVLSDNTSAMGYTGTLTTRIHNLDTFLGILQDKAQDPEIDPKMKQQIMQTIQAAGFLQMIGQIEEGSDGKTRIYKVEIRPTGEILLNGTNMQTMMGGMGGNMGNGMEAQQETPAQ